MAHVKFYSTNFLSPSSGFFRPDEAALKIFNIFNSQTGSVWLLRAGMMPPFNVPDYRLPQPKIL